MFRKSEGALLDEKCSAIKSHFGPRKKRTIPCERQLDAAPAFPSDSFPVITLIPGIALHAV